MRSTHLLCAAVVLGAGAQAQSPAAVTRFDGTWDVTLSCPAAADARGYEFRFPADVRNGALHAEYGTRDGASSLGIDGAIHEDGSALLSARGRTGKTEYSVGRVAADSPYGYRIDARFDERRGTGRRLEMRECNFTFVRR